MMTINQAIYHAFSTACKLTVVQSFETVFLNFRPITPFVKGQSKLVVVEEGR